MKWLIVALVAMLSGCANLNMAVVPPAASLERVVVIETVGKDELYERSRQYVATHYRSAQSVIQYESKPAGMMIVKGIVKSAPTDPMVPGLDYRFTETIAVKDGRAKITWSNFVVISSGMDMRTIERQWELDALAMPFNLSVTALESALRGSKKTDDW